MSVHFCPPYAITTLKTSKHVVTVVRTWHLTDLRRVWHLFGTQFCDSQQCEPHLSLPLPHILMVQNWVRNTALSFKLQLEVLKRELYFVMTDRKYTCYRVRAAPYSLFSYFKLVCVVGVNGKHMCECVYIMRVVMYRYTNNTDFMYVIIVT